MLFKWALLIASVKNFRQCHMLASFQWHQISQTSWKKGKLY